MQFCAVLCSSVQLVERRCAVKWGFCAVKYPFYAVKWGFYAVK